MVILDSLLGLADMPVGLRDCPLVGNAEGSLAAAEGKVAPFGWDCESVRESVCLLDICCTQKKLIVRASHVINLVSDRQCHSESTLQKTAHLHVMSSRCCTKSQMPSHLTRAQPILIQDSFYKSHLCDNTMSTTCACSGASGICSLPLGF